MATAFSMPIMGTLILNSIDDIASTDTTQIVGTLADVYWTIDGDDTLTLCWTNNYWSTNQTNDAYSPTTLK